MSKQSDWCQLSRRPLPHPTHLCKQIHADQHLHEIVDEQCVFELKWFAVFHEARSPRVDEVEVESENGQARHGRFD